MQLARWDEYMINNTRVSFKIVTDIDWEDLVILRTKAMIDEKSKTPKSTTSTNSRNGSIVKALKNL